MRTAGVGAPRLVGNIKTWITLLVLLQLGLVLLYLDATQRNKGPPRPLRLQSRVTLDHSRYTSSPDGTTPARHLHEAPLSGDPPPTKATPHNAENPSSETENFSRSTRRRTRHNAKEKKKKETLYHNRKKEYSSKKNRWLDEQSAVKKINSTQILRLNTQIPGAKVIPAKEQPANKLAFQPGERVFTHGAALDLAGPSSTGTKNSFQKLNVPIKPARTTLTPLNSATSHLKATGASVVDGTSNTTRRFVDRAQVSPTDKQNTNSVEQSLSEYVAHPSGRKEYVDGFALNLDLSKPHVFRLPEPVSTERYFRRTSNPDEPPSSTIDHASNQPKEKCFVEGTAFGLSSNTYGCLCDNGYHGKHCSIPDIVYYSSASRFVELLTVRNTSRRIINAIAFNVEFELLEARLHELQEVVDVFIVLESNFSNFGQPKPMRLYERLQRGYLKEFHAKLFYLFLEKFPSEGKSDGWIVDQNMRHFIGAEGLRRVVNKKPDDLFIYSDADEIPSREALLFLKIHDGYPEPFGFTLRWSVFGFFWKQLEPTRVYAGCTVAMMRYVFRYDAFLLRSGDYHSRQPGLISAYKQTGGRVFEWHLGEMGLNAGWHCSWCLPPDRIKVKLQSAINADFPRWGDFPDKLRLDYIANLIRTGTWFDDTTRFGELADPKSDSSYAPKYILNHFEKYKRLLNLEDAVEL